MATVAIDGARNAGILACQILALKYKKIAVKIEKYKKELERSDHLEGKDSKESKNHMRLLVANSCRVQICSD